MYSYYSLLFSYHHVRKVLGWPYNFLQRAIPVTIIRLKLTLSAAAFDTHFYTLDNTLPQLFRDSYSVCPHMALASMWQHLICIGTHHTSDPIDLRPPYSASHWLNMIFYNHKFPSAQFSERNFLAVFEQKKGKRNWTLCGSSSYVSYVFIFKGIR